MPRRISTPWALVGAEQNGKVLKLAFSFGDGCDEHAARAQVTEAHNEVTISVTLPFDDSREAYAAWLGTGHVDVMLARELDDRDLLHGPTEVIEGGPFHVAD